MNTLATLPPQPTQRQSFAVETRSAAEATRSAALIAAYFTRAEKKARDWDEVRVKLLRRCRTPEFARSPRTWYHKPIGKGVEGFGIGFVEEALQCMTNTMRDSTMIFEDELIEVWKATVVDLETNSPIDQEFKVTKTVERSKPSDDGTYLAVRRNSYGNLVYTVSATDDDMLNKREALRSKAMRTVGLKLIPGDLKDECARAIKETRMNEAAKDPDAERKRIADAFAEVGVKPAQLTAYLGHDMGTCTPAELTELRGIYSAIKEGEATWSSVMENKTGGDDDGSGAGEKKPSASERVKERLRAKKGNPPAEPPASAGGAATGPDGAVSQDPSPQASNDEPGVGAGGSDTSAEREQRMRDNGFENAPEGPDAETLRGRLMAAKDEDAANLIIDRARHLAREDYDGLVALLESRFPHE